MAMCGMAGIYGLSGGVDPRESIVKDMVHVMSHRGPDGDGFYYHPRIHLGHCRLSIVDIKGGAQPMDNEDGRIWIVFNGEIFNHIELRKELVAKGHVFKTHSDTEVLLHLYEEHGKDLCSYLNGQFAFAIWDSASESLFMARDRTGIIPLYYTECCDTLVFASEIKALFQFPGVERDFDPQGLHEHYTLWTTIAPRTVFRNVHEIPPGSYCRVNPQGLHVSSYWDFRFPDRDEYNSLPREIVLDNLRTLMIQAVRLRLRADVPVGTYLSGGLDSSITTLLARKELPAGLHTFSLRFDDPSYDEGSMQDLISREYKTEHHTIRIGSCDIRDIYTRMIWHTEKPVWRSSPGPMMLLSSLVREKGLKVILTGEGADEVFGGYNIFKENAIRRFWARDPGSSFRPRLFRSLYTYIERDDRASLFWTHFFGKKLLDTGNPLYSHMIRWSNSGPLFALYNRDFFKGMEPESPLETARQLLPAEFSRWHPLSQAQYLEMKIFLPGFLLSSQGERMLMGNSVEGRYPFLDHNVIEWASTLNPSDKLYGMNEKFVLKKTFMNDLPGHIICRPKQPYRAPLPAGMLLESPEIREFMSGESLKKCPVFDPGSVDVFIKRMERAGQTSARDEMIFNQLLSTLILYRQFISG